MDAVTFPIRVFKQLGVNTVVCEFQRFSCMPQKIYIEFASDKCGRRPEFGLPSW